MSVLFRWWLHCCCFVFELTAMLAGCIGPSLTLTLLGDGNVGWLHWALTSADW